MPRVTAGEYSPFCNLSTAIGLCKHLNSTGAVASAGSVHHRERGRALVYGVTTAEAFVQSRHLVSSLVEMSAFVRPAHFLRASLKQKSLITSRDQTCRRALVASRSVNGEGEAATSSKVSKVRQAMSGNGAGFTIISERPVFQRYQTIWDRKVRFPDGHVVSYDVFGNEQSNFKSVFVFPFHSATQTVTLIKEYSPGANEEQFSFVAGMFERDKHASLEQAAYSELSEEAHLKGGKLMPLSVNDTGISADKYSKIDILHCPFPQLQQLALAWL